MSNELNYLGKTFTGVLNSAGPQSPRMQTNYLIGKVISLISQI